MKNKIIISSILTIAMCVSLIAGSTFALFTSESKVDVAVSSATVSVTATPTTPVMGSTLGTALGTANAVGNALTLENFVPGDFATFKINVVNDSTVAVKYRTVISAEGDLFAGLVVTIDDVQLAGGTTASEWALIDSVTTNVAEVTVTVALPEGADNEFQGKSCTISYLVEAVQGNVSLVDDADDFALAVASETDAVILTEDIVIAETFEITNDVNINLNGKDLSVDGLIFSADANVYGGTLSSHGDKYTGVPHIIIASDRTVTFEDVTVNVDDFASYGAQGSLNYAELIGIAVEGALIMENCDIVVKNDVVRTWNYCYGIAVTNGTVVMNGGSIVLESIGASRINMTTAISSFNSQDTITLNNVNVVADYLGITYGTSHLIINANNSTLSSTAFDTTQGGTYELNVVND